ncbi:hypothetical protein CCR75_003964 [Bremia lactucae]|uniref:BED-type domain-containing protein n=1 Tax=Bremia lactucae TaxID=4779 RepID=A0A976FP40_BRELC|nr:hypothetical protein CCR75_003964 [Bremia lactucae]
MANSGDVCAFFFEPVYDSSGPLAPEFSTMPPALKKRGRKKSASLGETNRHRCRKCYNIYTQAVSTGYTNLLTHLRIKHPDWEEIFESQKLESPSPLVLEKTTTETDSQSHSIPTTSSAPKQNPSAGRKRGPVYEHFEEVALSSGKKKKTMLCLYCREVSQQLSARLKLHLATQCPRVPEDVKSKYAGAVGLKSNMSHENHSMAVVSTNVPSQPDLNLMKKETQLLGLEAVSIPALNSFNRDVVNWRLFEEKLTIAFVAAKAPWSLFDNVNFREALEMLDPTSSNSLLTAAHARTEVLTRLSQLSDHKCKETFATSTATTLVINTTEIGSNGAKQKIYLAVNDCRRVFVLASGRNPLLSIDTAEVVSIMSTLPASALNAHIFLCTPTSSDYGALRQELLDNGNPSLQVLSFMGACMTQQTALLLQDFVSCNELLLEALNNAILIADALKAMPSLRDRVLQSVVSDIDSKKNDASFFMEISVTSWRSIALAMHQATCLEPYLRSAISQEKEDVFMELPKMSLVVNKSVTDGYWHLLRHTAQLLVPLNYIAVLTEVQNTTSGQLLALWIWLFGIATHSPLFQEKADALATTFFQRLGCYVEEHFIACLILDPRVHGAGLSESGLHRAQGIAVRLATSLMPEVEEGSFVRSLNEYMKKQGGFADPSVWTATKTSSPIDFWGDLEGTQEHNQLAKVAKIVCSYMPHTCSFEDFWTRHAHQTEAVAEGSKELEKLAKVRRQAVVSGKSAMDVRQHYLDRLLENSPVVVEMLRSHASNPNMEDGNFCNLSVRSVLESVHDGMATDLAKSTTTFTELDATWFDISETGLEKIRRTMNEYLSSAK